MQQKLGKERREGAVRRYACCIAGCRSRKETKRKWRERIVNEIERREKKKKKFRERKRGQGFRTKRETLSLSLSLLWCQQFPGPQNTFIFIFPFFYEFLTYFRSPMHLAFFGYELEIEGEIGVFFVVFITIIFLILNWLMMRWQSENVKKGHVVLRGNPWTETR